MKAITGLFYCCRSFVLVSVLFGVLLPLGSCAAPPAPIYLEGAVVDAETKLPVAGAQVYAASSGSASMGLADTQSICVDLQATVTDAQGRFRIQAWQDSNGRVKGVTTVIGLYRAGYQFYLYGFAAKSFSESWVKTVYLNPYRGKRQERIKSFGMLLSPLCYPKGSEQAITAPLFQAILDEAEALSSGSQEDLVWVEEWRYYRDAALYGYEEAARRQRERKNAISPQ